MLDTTRKIKNEIWRRQSQIISEALEGLGYKIIYDTDLDDRVEFERKVVYINSRNHPETKFYTLLHEYGHIFIYENMAEKFESDYPMYYRVDDQRVERSRSARVSIVAEELEAWKIGRQFARNLYMHLDEDKYDKQMTESIMSYINWAADEPE